MNPVIYYDLTLSLVYDHERHSTNYLYFLNIWVNFFKYFLQKESLGVEESKIEEEIEKKLDVKALASASNMTIRIADFGCATGPNTLVNAHKVLEAMKEKYKRQCPNTEAKPEYHVFFNDLPSNDFNTFFTSLPEDRSCFACGVPGSFYNRLFPHSCIHFACSSLALHFLSKSPEVLQEKKSPAWNKGRIHHTGASKEVVDAYANQFAEDVGKFLDARAMELVPGGMLVIVMPGVPHGMPYSDVINGMLFDCMGSILIDLSKEVIIYNAFYVLECKQNPTLNKRMTDHEFIYI